MRESVSQDRKQEKKIFVQKSAEIEMSQHLMLLLLICPLWTGMLEHVLLLLRMGTSLRVVRIRITTASRWGAGLSRDSQMNETSDATGRIVASVRTVSGSFVRPS